MSGKKIFIVLVGIGVIAIAYYLISPLWRNVVVDEASPIIDDALETMTPQEKVEMETAMEEVKDVVMEKEETMPAGPTVLAEAAFVARAHEVEGKALLIESGDETTLRFEDFKTINGPDLRIYLSSGLGNDDFIDLGAIRATEGNVNYLLPPGTDTSRYNKVLVWCRAFSVLFSYAELE